MEGDPKTWIDEEFLKLAISNGQNDGDVTIMNYNVKLAVESGNNYCTQLFRVGVKYQKENIEMSKSLIVKAPLPDDSFAKLVTEEGQLLKNEYLMYTKVLPEIYAISKYQFGPKTYFCDKEDVLIMDDLTEDGYAMGDRLHQLDLQHSRKFLTTLAKYHAATVAVHQQNPELIESNGINPFYRDNMNNQTIKFLEAIKNKAFVTILKQLSGMEDLARMIEHCGSDIRTNLVKIFKRGGSVNILNHGDCWTNNIMFKYSEGGKISGCKLIDFQIRSYGSPATDVLYFLFTSARTEVRQQHMDELLELYCQTLNDTLMKFGIKKSLYLQDLREEIKEASLWALYVVMVYLPMILNEPNETSKKLEKNEENFRSSDINVNPALMVYLSKTYKAVLPGVCEDLIKLGVMDYLEKIKS